MRVALLFIDGVGVGRHDPALNPLATSGHLLAQFEDAPGTPLPAGGYFVSVDPTFDVPGRPQSATNQTALLTGEPAPRLLGRHVLGYPNPALRALLADHSLVRRLAAAGRRATFANAYPAGYLDALGLERRPSEGPDVHLPPAARRRLRASATTLAFAAGRVPLRTLDDARRGAGLTHDINGERARARGLSVPARTPEEAADVFWRIAAEADFTLFEHYLADEAGHARDWEAARAALSTFDGFLRAVLARRPHDTRLVVCSDHGNVEDLSTRCHTRHRVPVLYFGGEAADVAGLGTVADVGRALGRWLGAA